VVDAEEGLEWGTRSSVRSITGDERTEEVARMLNGSKVTETCIKHGKQMMKANA
jgi:DNA repair ATPase RecN